MSVVKPRQRACVVSTLVLLVATGCGEASRVDPDATVTISGVARAADGGPLDGRPVRLASGTTGGDAALALVTLGLACTAGICDDDVTSGTTDDRGAYRIEVQGRDTQTAFGNVRPQALSVAAAPARDEVSGASVAARFVVQTEALQLPPLQLVDPRLSIRSAAPAVEASWSTTTSGPYTLSFEGDSVVPVWETTSAGSTAAVDSRVLEDTQGRVVLSGSYTDKVTGSDLQATWRSPGLGYAAAAGAPLSRGQACRYEAPGVDAPSVAPVTCPLTDGDLTFAALPAAACASAPPGAAASGCTTAAAGVIELASAEPADLVVVRGCEGACAVEVSPDGQRFERVGSATNAYSAVRLPLRGVRAVRVGLGRGGLREVSLWGPAQGPGLRPLPETALDGLRAPYDIRAARLPLVALAVAGVAALAAVLGLGYALGSRRRRAR